MRVHALRYRLARPGEESLDVTPWAGLPDELAEKQPPSAYLVPEEALVSFRALDRTFNDRGRKHPARALGTILVRQPRVPLVAAPLKSGRQLLRSLRTLLDHAAEARERKAYLIGVPPNVYAEAAARVGADEEDRDDARLESSRDQELFLGDPEDVPPELERRLVGDSPEMRVVRQWIVRAARSDEPVLVLGDTGTGKEVVARAIHDLHPVRRVHHFLPVNCGAIPRDLFETELFGYVPGAFTHALRHGSLGLWRAARGGTIFLDEIGDLAPDHQVKILRVLEQNVVRPVGSTEEMGVNARVIAATNRDLYSMMLSGEFRPDLYYRLGAMIITLPALRDRSDDVRRLAAHFWREIAPRRPALTPDVLEELERHRWQGNARELRYILVNLHTTFPKAPPTVARLKAVMRLRAPSTDENTANGSDDGTRRLDCLRHLRRARAAIGAAERIARTSGARAADEDARVRLLADVGACLTELQLLGTRPERFGQVATFEATHRLAGGLAAYQSLLLQDDRDAVRYGRKELASEVAAAAAAVRRQEERILKAL